MKRGTVISILMLLSITFGSSAVASSESGASSKSGGPGSTTASSTGPLVQGMISSSNPTQSPYASGHGQSVSGTCSRASLCYSDSMQGGIYTT